MERDNGTARRRRWPRRVAFAALALVALVLVVVAGALAYAATPSGGERLRRLAVEQANKTIQGALAVRELSLRGGHLVLRGVELRDPDGGLVARAGEVEVRLWLPALVRKRVDLSLVRLDGPELRLVEDDRGTNLARAIARRSPAAPQAQPSGAGGPAITIDRLELARGVIDVLRPPAEEPRRVHLDDLAVSGSATMAGTSLAARVDVTARVAAPLDRPLQLSVAASADGDRRDARVAVTLGAAKLVAQAHQDDARDATARIESLVVPPDVARALAPAYPLRASASLGGDAERHGDRVALRLEARAASATVRLDSELDLAARRTRRTALTAEHVDLSELIEAGPSSDMALRLVAEGGGSSLEDAAGTVELHMPASRMAGQTMGPVHLRARADRGAIHVPELSVRAPGVRLDARGGGRKDRFAVRGTLDATDLGAFSRTLGKLFGPTGLSLRGQGRLALAVAGSVAHPSVKVDGGFPVLASGAARADGIAVHVNVPDLLRPARADARLTAAAVTLAPRKVLRAVQVAARSADRGLALDAAVHGYAELSVAARAALDADARGGTLRQLSVSYPEARWSLDAPVRVEARAGALAISPLTLRSGAQAIRVSVSRRGPKLDAAVAVEALDLGRLPRALVDPRLGLGGVVDLEAQARGRSARRAVEARVVLRGGRFRRYRGVELRLAASYAGDRAKGDLSAKGEGVEVTGAFDVPVKALATGGRAPVEADLHVAELRLDESLRDLGLTTAMSGRVSADVSVRGTAGDPRLDAALRGRRIQVRKASPVDVDLVARSGRDGALGARIDLTLDGRKSFVALETPFTLGDALRRPPTGSALLDAALVLDADVREVPLGLLSDAGLSTRPLGGVLSARTHLTGTARAPRGEVSIDGRGLATEGLPPTDATVRVRSGEDVRADVRVEQGGTRILEATAQIDPARLRDRARVADAPLLIDATVGPLPLAELQAALQPEDVDPAVAPPRLRGVLDGRVTIRGTPGDPRVAFRARVQGLGAEGTPDGEAAVDLGYSDARASLEAVLRSGGGEGELRAAATARVDLSYPAIADQPRLDTAPLDAKLSAKDFDPAFLSKVGGAVDKLGGRVSADAHLGGTLGSPAVNGRIEWRDGVVATHGSGEFTNIHLLATGDADRLELQDLSARSGRGKLSLSAQAVRSGAGYRLHAAATVDKLPVMSAGQVAATLSLRTTADGVTSPGRITIQKLDIPEAHVLLPDVQRKDVQKLDDPPDVVLTIRGKPVRGSKAKETEVASAAAPAGGTGSGVAEGVPAGTGHAPTQLTAVVNAPRNLWIQGNDVDTEVGLSDGFRVEYAREPRLFGDVNVIRGRLDVFGRRFDLQRDSKISFTGPVAKPDLNVTAAYKNELEQVTVTLKVQGQAGKLQLAPTSDPPLPETEIFTLLATGHTSLHHGTGGTSPSGEAASLVGSLAASQLKQTLSGKLPLDVLSIEAGNGGLSGTKLEAGTYVNDRLYVGFTGRLGADPMRGENSNEVDLEYQLSKRWSLTGRYGDAHAGDAGVTWRKEY